MNIAEIIPLIQTGGAIVCLVFAVRWLAGKFSDSQREMVDLMRGVIAQNSTAMHEVKDAMREVSAAISNCPSHKPPNRPNLK